MSDQQISRYIHFILKCFVYVQESRGCSGEMKWEAIYKIQKSLGRDEMM